MDERGRGRKEEGRGEGVGRERGKKRGRNRILKKGREERHIVIL